MNIFHSLDVVDRGGETQPQIGENLNEITYTVRVMIF